MRCTIARLTDGIFLDGQILTFENYSMTIKCKLVKKIALDMLVYIIVYDHLKGIIIFNGKVNSFLDNIVKVVNVKCVEIRQRRNETRVTIEFTLQVHKIQIDEDEPIVLHKKMLFKTVDISANGVLLTGYLDIPINFKFFIELPIKGSIPCIAQIVRKEERKNGFYYGCKLLDIGKDKMDKIREFVFKKQIEEYRSKPFLKAIDF